MVQLDCAPPAPPLVWYAPVPVTIATVRMDQMTGSLTKMEPLTWAWRKWTLACERERSTLSLRCISIASSLGMVAADGAARLGTSRSSLDLVGSGTCDDCNGANGADDR